MFGNINHHLFESLTLLYRAGYSSEFDTIYCVCSVFPQTLMSWCVIITNTL